MAVPICFIGHFFFLMTSSTHLRRLRSSLSYFVNLSFYLFLPRARSVAPPWSMLVSAVVDGGQASVAGVQVIRTTLFLSPLDMPWAVKTRADEAVALFELPLLVLTLS
jgi:hypothetical protein